MRPNLTDLDRFDALQTDDLLVVDGFQVGTASVLRKDGSHQGLVLLQLDFEGTERSWFAMTRDQAFGVACLLFSLFPDEEDE